MPRRIEVTTLNASTMDILNTIRANAGAEYQTLVPVVEVEKDIPKVGEVLYGYPQLANRFLSELVNRIAITRIKSASFNNRFVPLKKGFLEFGETVEEVFVNIARAREFSAEKAASREFKRTLPDVRAAFHAINWRVQYPVTVQDMDLYQAFKSIDGVQELIAKIVDSVYTAAEYDEYLLFKYLIIKGVTGGKMFNQNVDLTSGFENAAISFRGISNMLEFMSTHYNASGVHTATPKRNQYIFMDAMFNAKYDVTTLAAAFNMDKAEFMGHLILVDSFSTFDNERFTAIRAGSDQIEEITQGELTQMSDVIAVLVDEEWFQFYDNQAKFTEDYVAAGEYWNYFYNVWKTVSTSPFSNAVVFWNNATLTLPDSITVTVDNVSTSEINTVLTFTVTNPTNIAGGMVNFIQDEDSTKAGIAIHRYGAVMFTDKTGSVTLTASLNGQFYKASTTITPASTPGTSVTLSKTTDSDGGSGKDDKNS